MRRTRKGVIYMPIVVDFEIPADDIERPYALIRRRMLSASGKTIRTQNKKKRVLSEFFTSSFPISGEAGACPMCTFPHAKCGPEHSVDGPD
jgi:hypothetical protein